MTHARHPQPRAATTGPSRRGLLKLGVGGLIAAAVAEGLHVTQVQELLAAQDAATPTVGKGHIKQTVCQWCYGGLTKTAADKDKFYETIAKMGYVGVDLAGEGDFAALKKHGLICSMLNSFGIPVGFNRVANHESCLKSVRKSIEAAAAAGFPNVICFSGNRHQGQNDKDGITDEAGVKASIEGLKHLASFAEEKNITVSLELLNSHGHKDYMADHTAWGVEVCKGVSSPRIKLLFDIYHMAEMGEDVFAMIKQHHEYFGHYHTGGVPGRNEIDETQKLNYTEVMKTIVATGYQGYVGQEFIPKRDPLTSLQQAFKICDV